MLATVTACGFTPVHQAGSAATALQNSVLVQAPKTREAFVLTRQLEDRLGRATDPRFGLNLTITTSEEELGIDPEGDISRFNILGQADYSLRDTSTGVIVTSGTVSSFTGYSATGTTVSARTSEKDAQDRLMVILANQIVTRLQATISTQ